jgi:hypothetical protein
VSRVVAWVDRLPVGKKGAAGILGAVIAAAVGAFGVLSSPGSDCADTPLRHVYHPQRLKVIATCQRITVTVRGWRHEHDDDYHVNVDVDGGGWTTPANARQHDQTVIEFVPGDPRPQEFHSGQRLELVVTKVYDQQHKRRVEDNGWIEGHPVFSETELPGPAIGGQVPAPANE